MASAIPIPSIAPITSFVTTVTGSSIESITKLKSKNNYKEWRNAMQDYCRINGTWRYMIGEILQPSKPTENKPGKAPQYEKDLAKWNTISNSLEGAIRCTVTVDPMSHVHGLFNCYLMWKKFQTLYKNTGFLERDAIFIWLSTKTLEDFQGVAKFADAIKRTPHD